MPIKPQPYLTENGKAIFNKILPMYPNADSYELSILAHSYDQYQYFSEMLENYKKDVTVKPIDLQRVMGMVNTAYKQAAASFKALSKLNSLTAEEEIVFDL